jgi:hypothetical protein
MTTNEAPLDRIVRVVLALAAGVGAFAVGASTVLGIVLLVIAAVLLVTAATGFCPLYRVLGISTCRVPARG